MPLLLLLCNDLYQRQQPRMGSKRSAGPGTHREDFDHQATWPGPALTGSAEQKANQLADYQQADYPPARPAPVFEQQAA